MTDNHRHFLRKHQAPRRWSLARALLASAAGTVVVAGVTMTPASATTTLHPSSRQAAASVPGSLSGTLTIGERAYFQPTMTQLVAAYEKYRPGVKIQVQQLPNDNTYQTKLLTEKLSGSLPDIIATYDVLSPTLTTQGVEANLTPYLNSADLYPQSYWLPNFLASYIMDSGPDTGQVHALPMEADATVMYYNENEFTAAGVPFPSSNWTWSQMLADAKKLEKFKGGKQVQWGVDDTPDWQAVYNPMIKDFGGTAFGPKSAGLDTPAALKTWATLVDPTTNGEALPYSLYLTDANAFQDGQVAMYIGVRAQLPGVRTGTQGKFKFNVVAMPYILPGKRPTGAGSVGWAITTQDSNIKLSLDFLHWLYSGSGGMPILEASYGVVPAVPSLFGPDQLWRKLPGPPANESAFVTAASEGLVAPQVPGVAFNTSATDIPKAIEAVVDSGESIAKAFTTLNQQVDTSYSSAG
jgi:multiple sugar transport system substrate-binding protein